ncbi:MULTISPECIES: sulfurtransferase complex subunit TusB [Dickeya]|uniref:tRNA 5-methylaminomethyl-2-thiouridine synthase TusB n=1 Tax=Dickeya aquatica TaxID=1401087 RepID=A0A375AFR2_9GAMM|nr:MULTISPECIES: sulfurtransferase complex subunit TusB [Dickeya]SLM64827.1 tRNA 5-methylaminomethyl-2-thiouridine synthase TusB [Dickeya aquatica]
MLHTLSHSPYHTDLPALLRMVTADDALLLIQDGVIAAIDGSLAWEHLCASCPAPVYALIEDVHARGLSAQISTMVTLVDYTEFVRLTALHARQLAW